MELSTLTVDFPQRRLTFTGGARDEL